MCLFGAEHAENGFLKTHLTTTQCFFGNRKQPCFLNLKSQFYLASFSSKVYSFEAYVSWTTYLGSESESDGFEGSRLLSVGESILYKILSH